MALNPHQKNKVDISKLSEEEQKLFRLYGKLPNKKDLLQNKLKERKYFDSGDYAMSKAGKSDAISGLGGGLGREHPSPETIPHLSQQVSNSNVPTSGSVGGGPGTPTLHPTLSQGQSGSPVKEGSYLQRGMSVDEQDSEEIAKEVEKNTSQGSENAGEKSIPIRKQ